MTETSQIRKQNQEYIRELQQEKANKRKALSDQAQKDMKELKDYYKNENLKLDEEVNAAIVHVKKENEQLTEEERQIRIEEQKQTYNRQAQLSQKANQNNQVRQSQASNQSSNQQVKNQHLNKETLRVQSKEDDPFYKVLNHQSQVKENSDGYTIKAFIPAQDKDDVRLTIQDNKAVISGKRKFQNTVENEEKKLSTNNFQTYHEEFKFNRPVTTQGITREREGDYMTFFIPKLESLKFDEES
ncbi:MAG: hypothetical protein ACK4VO_03805 [Pseudobdellovibrio sp.]